MPYLKLKFENLKNRINNINGLLILFSQNLLSVALKKTITTIKYHKYIKRIQQSCIYFPLFIVEGIILISGLSRKLSQIS